MKVHGDFGLTMSVLRPSEIRTWIHLPDWYLDPLEEGYGLVTLESVSCISYGWLRVSRAPRLLTTTTGRWHVENIEA